MFFKVIILIILLAQSHGLEFLCATYNSSSSNNSMHSDFHVDGDALTQRSVSNLSCEINDGGSACYGFWKNGTSNATSSKPTILKGCWNTHQDCFNKSECVANYIGNNHYFCCCDTPLCNIKMTLTSEPSKSSYGPMPPMPKERDYPMVKVIVITLLPILLLALVVVFAFLLWRVCRERMGGESSGSSNSIESKEAPLLPPARASPTPSVDAEAIIKNIEILEIIATRNMGGSVKKARLENELVAVKVFTSMEKAAWEKERDMYTTTGLNCIHPNILRFIAAVKHESHMRPCEYWIITEFQELGTLHDYLRSHTLSWREAINIVLSSCQGLAFVHSSSDEKVTLFRMEGKKYPVAHRDIKSKNILLKNNKTACIADFGLALTLGSKTENAHSQVGTLRYMSPEVLDGSIRISDESFKKIDSYAMGLVIWEILTRTYANGVDAAVEYRLPFDEEINELNLENLKQAVVDKHLRPHIRQEWRDHEGMNILVSAMEELWEHDSEGRLFISTAYHRLLDLKNNERDRMSSNRIVPVQNVARTVAFGSENVQSPKKGNTSSSKDQDMTCISIDTDDDYIVTPLNPAKMFNQSESNPKIKNGYLVINNKADKMYTNPMDQHVNKIISSDNHYSPNVTPFGIQNLEKYQSPQHLVRAYGHETMPFLGNPYAGMEGFSTVNVKNDHPGLIVSGPEKPNHVASPRV